MARLIFGLFPDSVLDPYRDPYSCESACESEKTAKETWKKILKRTAKRYYGPAYGMPMDHTGIAPATSDLKILINPERDIYLLLATGSSLLQEEARRKPHPKTKPFHPKHHAPMGYHNLTDALEGRPRQINWLFQDTPKTNKDLQDLRKSHGLSLAGPPYNKINKTNKTNKKNIPQDRMMVHIDTNNLQNCKLWSPDENTQPDYQLELAQRVARTTYSLIESYHDKENGFLYMPPWFVPYRSCSAIKQKKRSPHRPQGFWYANWYGGIVLTAPSPNNPNRNIIRATTLGSVPLVSPRKRPPADRKQEPVLHDHQVNWYCNNQAHRNDHACQEEIDRRLKELIPLNGPREEDRAKLFREGSPLQTPMQDGFIIHVDMGAAIWACHAYMPNAPVFHTYRRTCNQNTKAAFGSPWRGVPTIRNGNHNAWNYPIFLDSPHRIMPLFKSWKRKNPVARRAGLNTLRDWHTFVEGLDPEMVTLLRRARPRNQTLTLGAAATIGQHPRRYQFARNHPVQVIAALPLREQNNLLPLREENPEEVYNIWHPHHYEAETFKMQTCPFVENHMISSIPLNQAQKTKKKNNRSFRKRIEEQNQELCALEKLEKFWDDVEQNRTHENRLRKPVQKMLRENLKHQNDHTKRLTRLQMGSLRTLQALVENNKVLQDIVENNPNEFRELIERVHDLKDKSKNHDAKDLVHAVIRLHALESFHDEFSIETHEDAETEDQDTPSPLGSTLGVISWLATSPSRSLSLKTRIIHHDPSKETFPAHDLRESKSYRYQIFRREQQQEILLRGFEKPQNLEVHTRLNQIQDTIRGITTEGIEPFLPKAIRHDIVNYRKVSHILLACAMDILWCLAPASGKYLHKHKQEAERDFYRRTMECFRQFSTVMQNRIQREIIGNRPLPLTHRELIDWNERWHRQTIQEQIQNLARIDIAKAPKTMPFPCMFESNQDFLNFIHNEVVKPYFPEFGRKKDESNKPNQKPYTWSWTRSEYEQMAKAREFQNCSGGAGYTHNALRGEDIFFTIHEDHGKTPLAMFSLRVQQENGSIFSRKVVRNNTSSDRAFQIYDCVNIKNHSLSRARASASSRPPRKTQDTTTMKPEMKALRFAEILTEKLNQRTQNLWKQNNGKAIPQPRALARHYEKTRQAISKSGSRRMVISQEQAKKYIQLVHNMVAPPTIQKIIGPKGLALQILEKIPHTLPFHENHDRMTDPRFPFFDHLEEDRET